MNAQDWLNTSPLPEEVQCLQKDGTGKYIPYDIIVEKLYQLCGHEWSTSNLQVTYINLPNRKTLISGTIEVEVNYATGSNSGIKIIRRLTGGANFIVNGSKIPHTSASVKSLAIMNAVKPLGVQFGKDLNKGEEPTPQELYNPEAAKQQEIAGFIEAIKEAGSLKAVHIFKNTVARENNNELSEAYALQIKKLGKLPQIKQPKVQLP